MNNQSGLRVIMKRLLIRYGFFLIALSLLAGIFIFHKQSGVQAVRTIVFSLREVVIVLPPIFILIGLMDVWAPREKMVRFMGEGSGLKGRLCCSRTALHCISCCCNVHEKRSKLF